MAGSNQPRAGLKVVESGAYARAIFAYRHALMSRVTAVSTEVMRATEIWKADAAVMYRVPSVRGDV